MPEKCEIMENNTITIFLVTNYIFTLLIPKPAI
jgi:hypothetical protein